MYYPAKKSLGQNWLNSPSAIKKMVEAGDIKLDDTIIEVGPGRGVLTKALLETGAKVIAIEKDHRLLEELQNTFAKAIYDGQLEIIEGDILNFPLEILTNNEKSKVIANIPYYITGELLRTFLEQNHQPDRLVLMVQKEVADRITARDNKESILSISVKVYGEPKIIAKVPAGAFIPKPKVDSAILAITNINRNNFKHITDTDFFTVLKKGFSQKRKLLRNNLSCSIETLIKCTIDANARAENLSPHQWLLLTEQITNHA